MMASSSSSILTTTITLFSTFNSATSRTLLQITTTQQQQQQQQQNQTALQSSPPPITSPSFRPSIPIIIGIITILLAITFLILLYTRHRNSTPTTTTTTTTTIGAVAYYLGGSHHHHHHHRHNTTIGYGLTPPVIPSSTRKNSGVDRTLIESLPVFRFGSLRGRNKDGLECAVCLNRFESIEVLRLLPKCKHAFHVECVDTWLDAHSTCPLCRYRVDPEDLLLLIEPCIETVPVRVMDQDNNNFTTTTTSSSSTEIPARSEVNRKIYTRRSSSSSFVMDTIRRVAGRHSSAGEMSEQRQVSLSLCRRSYDDEVDRWCNERRVMIGNGNDNRCFDRSMIRKDGLLLLPTIHQETDGTVRKKMEHQIIISDESVQSLYKRWSDVLPSDLLYLRSKMVMNDARRRFSLTEVGWRRSVIGFDKWRERRGGGDGGSGSGRSMSEMTGVSRVGMV